MPSFTYEAVDAQGKKKNGSVEASDQNQAQVQLRGQGLFVTKIIEQKARAAAKATGGATGRGRPGKVKSKTLTVFTRQLATLIDAGLPLIKSLNTLLKQEKNPALRFAMYSMTEGVEAGSTFSETLAQHPRIFDKLYVNMVRAGEVGGVLEQVLARLAEFQEKSEKIKGKVMSAMMYPAIVLLIAVAIMLFLLVFIVPKFEAIFNDMLGGRPLPIITQFVLGVSRLVMDQIYVLLGGAVVGFVGFKIFAATPAGTTILDKLKLNAPVLGPLVQKTAISRFTRTLGTLVSSGVPILQALNITKETAGNVILSSAIAKVHDAVKEGETIVAPLESSGIFPPLVVSMIQVGEEVGKLPDMLIRVANVYEEEVDNAVAGLTSMLEPIMIVFLAVVVGTIVIALFLPLVSIIQTLGGGS